MLTWNACSGHAYAFSSPIVPCLDTKLLRHYSCDKPSFWQHGSPQYVLPSEPSHCIAPATLHKMIHTEDYCLRLSMPRAKNKPVHSFLDVTF